MAARRLRSSLYLLLLAAFLQACVSNTPVPLIPSPIEEIIDPYDEWSLKHGDEILAYQSFLDAHAVGDVVPLRQLLKSARDWQKCNAEPFTLPPRELWPNIVPTLLVVRKFKTSGKLQNPVAASVYRDPVLNACAGGSPKSRHMLLNAIDFDIDVGPGSLETLCDAWRTEGPALNLGLGFYTPQRIHLDTLGFRSWGKDYSAKTSLCLQEK